MFNFKNIILNRSFVFLILNFVILNHAWGASKNNCNFRQELIPSSCTDQSKDLSLSKLQFVNFPLSTPELKQGKCSIINGVCKDENAIKSCPAGYIINPGNPQYHEGDQKYGSGNTNNVGFYYCFQNTSDYKKESLCTKAREKNNQDNGSLKIEWKSTSAKDGNCVCSNEDDKKFNCGMQAQPEPKSDIAQQPAAAPATEEKPKQEKTPADDILEKCIRNKYANLNPGKCKESMDTAKKQCDDIKVKNETANKMGQWINVANNVGQQFMTATGSGSASKCFELAAAAQTANLITNTFKSSCDTEVKACNEDCKIIKDLRLSNSDKRKEIIAACMAEAYPQTENKEQVSLAKTKEKLKEERDPKSEISNWTVADNFITDLLDDSGLKSPSTLCQKAADTSASWGSEIENLAKIALQAQMCRCQFQSAAFAASGVSNCNDTPSAEQCLANPSLAGCNVVQASTCIDGTGAACQALGITTPVVSNINGANGFAGARTNSITNPGTAAIGKLSADDLSYGSNLGNASGTQLADGNALGGAANGGGAPGGVGPSGGSGGGAPGGGGEEPAGKTSALGGFFNTAKSGLMNMLGLGGSRNQNNSNNNRSLTDQQLRELKMKSKLRGVASQNGDIPAESKNKRIWDIMSQQYKNQEHTLISN